MAVFNEFPFTHYFQGFLVDANVLGGKYCTALITEESMVGPINYAVNSHPMR